MKKLIALFVLLLALPAFATTTQVSTDGGKNVVITFSTGTESDPTTDGTLGIRLDGLNGFSIMVHSATNMTAGGIYRAFLWNANLSKWVRVTDGTLDLVTSASTDQAWSGLQVLSPNSRIMWVPYGVGVATTMYLVGTAK